LCIIINPTAHHLFYQFIVMAQQGEAAGYYGTDPNAYKQQQQQQPYPPQPYQQQGYPPPPPYGYAPQQPDPNQEKYTFDHAFKVEKPKLNDLWAGILVCLPRIPAKNPFPTKS
jgi:hypothetical protein